MNNVNRKNFVNIIIFASLICFYLFFAFFDGVILCDDSSSYILMDVIREPFYPLIIAFMRWIFPNNHLIVLVYFQSILLAIATYALIEYVVRKNNIESYYKFLFLLVFISVSILCRFVSKRQSMYSNCILSEAIAYPLFLLFIRYIYEYLLDGEKKPLIISSIISLLLISTRKQMFLTLIIIVCSVFFKGIVGKTIKKNIIKCLVIALIVFLSSKIIDIGYMKVLYGANSTHTSDNRFISTVIVYNSSKDDANLIDDENVKKLFIDIYDKCEINGYLKDYSLDNWYDRVNHFKDNYDNIQIKVMWPTFKEYANKHNNYEAESLVDKYNNIIIDSLLKNKFGDILLTFIDNLFAGLIITVSADKSIFIGYSIIIYLVYIALLVINIKKHSFDNIAIFSLLSLMSIFINTAIVSAVIFNQTRYTIYNMPLFYISLLLMIYNIFINKKIENKYEKNK